MKLSLQYRYMEQLEKLADVCIALGGLLLETKPEEQDIIAEPIELLGGIGNALTDRLKAMPEDNDSEHPGRYMVFNKTDGVYVTHQPVSYALADMMKLMFPKRFEHQGGLYRTADGRRIPATKVELEIQPYTEPTPEDDKLPEPGPF